MAVLEAPTVLARGAGQVIGVVGGSGGVGASTFAAVLAICLRAAVLVDLDPAAGGIDVVLGIEDVPGARWSGMRLSGGRLEPGALLDGLPRAGPCAVLAADVAELDEVAVAEVLSAATELGPVVLDLPRSPGAARSAALSFAQLLLVLARGDVPGLVAAHAVVDALPSRATGLLVRRGAVPARRAARLVGVPLVGELPPLGAAPVTLDPARLPRAVARVAAGVGAGSSLRPRRPPAGRA